MLPFPQALQRVLALAPSPPDTQTEALSPHSAVTLIGRVLAEPLIAQLDRPDVPRSRMDGYALRSADLKPNNRLPVAGVSRASDIPAALPPGHAGRIFTGAPLPANADTVVPVEQVHELPSQDQTPDQIELGQIAQTNQGDWIRQRGEDFCRGQHLLPAGTVLNERTLALAVAAGCRQLLLHNRVRVAFVRLGSELTAAGQPLPHGGQYDLNGLLLAGALARLAVDSCDLGVVDDDIEMICDRLAEAASRAEVVLTSGGASVGEEDFLGPALERLGQLHFRRVGLRPGMPLVVGSIGKTAVLGLPGNPQSVFACFHLLAKPLIVRAMGAHSQATAEPLTGLLDEPLANASENRLLLQGQYRRDKEQVRVRALSPRHSALIGNLALANCAINVEPQAKLGKDDPVSLWPYSSF